MSVVDLYGTRLKLNRAWPITIFEVLFATPIQSNVMLESWRCVSSGHLLSQTFTMRDVCVVDIVFHPSSPPSVSVPSDNNLQSARDSLADSFEKQV
jgi:hypothetical protein